METKIEQNSNLRLPNEGETFCVRLNDGSVYIRVPNDKGMKIFPTMCIDEVIFGASLKSGNIYAIQKSKDIKIVEPKSLCGKTIIFQVKE